MVILGAVPPLRTNIEINTISYSDKIRYMLFQFLTYFKNHGSSFMMRMEGRN